MDERLKQDAPFGNNLKQLRKRVHLSQKEASAQPEVKGHVITPDILAKTEQGRYSVKISVLLDLKEIYGVHSFDEFFVGLSPYESRQEESHS